MDAAQVDLARAEAEEDFAMEDFALLLLTEP